MAIIYVFFAVLDHSNMFLSYFPALQALSADEMEEMEELENKIEAEYVIAAGRSIINRRQNRDFDIEQ